MKEKQLQEKIQSFVTSDYFNREEMDLIDNETDRFVKKIRKKVGYDDGAALDKDATKFVVVLLKMKLDLEFGNYA